MNQEHKDKDIRTFNSGAVGDLSREIIGAENKGIYYDSLNGRVSSDRGNKGDWEKIRGEEKIWGASLDSSWSNMVSEDINGDIFEIWVKINGTVAPFISINGIIMGQSPDMPFDYDFPIQSDKNESCIGGEIMLTDNNTSPLIFNILDIKDNYSNGTLKYFGEYNNDLYSTNLVSPLDIPIFIGLENVGVGGGLPVGSYQYSIRYVNDDGDRTNFGPNTPAIPVLSSESSESSKHPWIKTVGGVSNSSVKTKFGIKLRFRVTNESNYNFIEVKRLAYNSSQGIDSVPAATIVAKLDISAGEVSVREFIDPLDSNEDLTLSEGEEVGSSFIISKAKTVRYHDKRVVLMNITTSSKDAQVTLKEYNGKKIFPVVEKLGKEGFSKPVNHTYKKNYMSGDKNSFALAFFDSVAGRSFAFEHDSLKNIQAPNRRDKVTTDSKNFSYKGTVRAASTDIVVDQTFEAFDHVDASSKTKINGFYNILDSGRDKSAGQVYQYGRTDQGEGYGSQINCNEIGYKPMRPVSNDDTTNAHDFIINPKVDVGTSIATVERDYRPRGFGLNYYSKGYALAGVDNIPSWAKSFSILRSKRAGRVLCQGIGMYALEKGEFGIVSNKYSASKKANKLWFHSPDVAAGLVNIDDINDIISNSSSYKVQFISPLGFFSEVYSFEQNALFGNRDYLIDMVAYARVIKDNGQINVGESLLMGQGDSNGERYVTYNRYRNSSIPGGGVFNTVNKGNQLIGIADLVIKTEGRNTYFEITLQNNIYANQFTGGNNNNSFNDQGMMDFTEPMYMVNIIKEGAVVPDLNINEYYSTGHYQKVKSLIGLGDGSNNQEFILVDERWEDCIPSLTLGGFNFGAERFIYIENPAGTKTLFNVTYKTTIEKQVIVQAINTNGFFTTPGGVQIKGIYTHKVVGDDIFIVFDYSGSNPQDGDKIYVKYDNRVPIRFFGGDTVVAENIFAPIDKSANADSDKDSDMFGWNIGFPYKQFRLNPGVYIPKHAGNFYDLQTTDKVNLGYLRQLTMVYTCESVTSSNYNINQKGVKEFQFFPATHYVMRPNRYDDSSFGGSNPDDISDDNGIYKEYFDDYPEEWSIWDYGGIRMTPNRNHDYSVRGLKDFFSKPKFGYKEENHFCTGVAWSLSRATNQQDSPGLKTFLSSNFYEANDDCGGIKKAWDAKADASGQNLYAVADKGIALLLTKKSILSNLNGDDLAVTSIDNFISGELWLSKTVGSNDQMWRGMAEASVQIETQSGLVEVESLFIPNQHSIYLLSNNTVKDVLKNEYRNKLLPVIKAIGAGYSTELTGHYDRNHNEYWFQSGKTYVFDVSNSRWIGRFDYSFDKYLFSGNKNYGFKDRSAYELDKGFIINGNPIRCELLGFSAPQIGYEKEFIDIEVMTGKRGAMKPSFIHFYDEDVSILSTMSEPNYGPLYLKQRDGWYGQIPRKGSGVSPNRERIQVRLLLFEIVHTFEEDFKVSQVHLGYKKLK